MAQRKRRRQRHCQGMCVSHVTAVEHATVISCSELVFSLQLPWPLGTMEDLQTIDLSISLRRKASMKFMNASSGKIPNVSVDPPLNYCARSIRAPGPSLQSETKALARERLRQLPLQPDALGRLHFHAVLLALVEQASTVPPLGDPTHAVVVDRPSKPPLMRWTPRWFQWHSTAAVDEAARAADTARFTSAMAPRKDLTVATQTSVATRMSQTGVGETVVDLMPNSPRSPDRPFAGSLSGVSPRELATRELVVLDSGRSIGLEREELGVVPEEDAMPSTHSPGGQEADHARRRSGIDEMAHPPDEREENQLFRLLQHVRSQFGARQHSTRSTHHSDSGRLAGMGPSRLASDEISLHSNSARLREAGGPPISQTSGLSTNSGRLREVGGPPVSQTSGLSTNSGRLREVGGPPVSQTSGLRTSSSRRGGRSLLGVPPPQLRQRPAEQPRDANARGSPGVRSLAGPSDVAGVSRRVSMEAMERERSSLPHATAPQRPPASPGGPSSHALPPSPPHIDRADSLGGLSVDRPPSESSLTGPSEPADVPRERVGSAEGSGAPAGSPPAVRVVGVSLREAFQQRKATMATISTRFLARQRSLRMLPSPPPERQARHPESPAAAGDSFEPPRGQAWAAPPLERGSSSRHSPSKRFMKQASGLLSPPALDMAGGGGRAAATVVRALSSSPPSPLIAPGGVRPSAHPSKAAISVRSLLTSPVHAAGPGSDATYAAISARPELLPPREAGGSAATPPPSTESVALGTFRAPEPAMVSARARAALARVLADDRDRGGHDRAEPLASAPEEGAPNAARSGTLPGGIPRRSSSE